MSGQYTNTTLIECNRLFSEEYKGGNSTQKSMFTNKTTPIHLKEGDQISLHSGYIAEVGAGGEVIEFEGKETDYKYKLNSTNLSPSHPNPYLPYGYERIDASTTEKEFTVQDNKASIQINYYTNLNGDCHILLPRKFDKEYAITDNNGFESHYGKNWSGYDSVAMGEVTTQPNIQHQLKADWQNFHADDTLTDIRRRRVVENSRMKIYTRKKQAYKSGNNTSDVASVVDTDFYANPLLYTYVPYQEIIDFELDKGYDTPSNIAQTMTNIMTKTDPAQPVNASVGTGANAFYKTISTRLESSTYKSFYCANESTFSFSTFEKYAETEANWNEDTMKYISNFNYIGVKRPEFFDTGRYIGGEFGFSLISLKTQITNASKATAVIETNIPWNSKNFDGTPYLESFRDWFKAQDLYPEFWDYDYNTTATQNNSRFIHMNSSNLPNEDNQDGNMLGQDNWKDGSTIDRTSCPVFFHYIKAKRNQYSEGEYDDDLCYGFARKVNGNIAFITAPIGGIPATQTTLFNSSGVIEVSRQLGYDWHSSAYGNSHCILYTGFLRSTIDDSWAYQDTNANNQLVIISDKLQFTYLGANSPLFNFDGVGNRFNFSYLHTPERVGQQFKAGFDENYPVVGDADEECYKLNKVPSHYTFTPDLKPYNHNITELGKNLFVHNFNFGRFRIIDSQTGIFFETFGNGITEETFKETLWFKLGFSYNQLFTPEDQLRNCQTRIDSITDPNTTLITTNSDAVSGDVSNYNVNIFSNEMYSTQAPLIQNATANPNNLTVPPITIQTNSAIISADNLPIKTNKPYFIIRTSLLGEPTFQGGINSNELFPVIAVVSKVNGYSDFFTLEENQILYTVTKAMTISQITTSIHDPDQSLSNVDESSSIIYKIIRNRNQPNLLQNIMNPKK